VPLLQTMSADFWAFSSKTMSALRTLSRYEKLFIFRLFVYSCLVFVKCGLYNLFISICHRHFAVGKHCNKGIKLNYYHHPHEHQYDCHRRSHVIIMSI
jgi:hypothetical protein